MNTVNEIISNAKEIMGSINRVNAINIQKSVIDYTKLANECPINFDGSLKYIVENVANGVIEPVEVNGMFAGIHVNVGNTLTETEIASQKFGRAYMCKPVLNYTALALMLKAAGLTPDEYINDNVVIVASNATAYDINCKVVASLTDEQLTNVNSKEEIIEMLKTELNNKPQHHSTTFTVDLPTELELTEDDITLNATDREVEKYIRYTYAHCLARGTHPTITRENNVTKVTDIQWGRALSSSEIADIEANM